MKIILTILVLLSATTLNAQFTDEHDQRILIHKLIDIPAGLLLTYLVISFILAIIKLVLDARIKYKMIEKGVSEELIKQFLQPNTKELQREALKWVIVFAGISLGLFVSLVFKPLGIHTLAILSLSIAVSFLVYYRFVKSSLKN